MAVSARRYLFQGHVQGVGFRRISARIAESFDVYGIVRNLSDGRVELVVEGESDEISRYLAELKKTFANNILYFSEEKLTPQNFGEFRVTD